MFSPSGGKSTFLCWGNGTASNVNALQVGSSALWKEAGKFFKPGESFWSCIFKHWYFSVQKRAIYLMVHFFFFWNEYRKIVYSCSCERFHKWCTDNKNFSSCSFHFPGEFAHCRWAVWQTFAGIFKGLLSLSWKKLLNLVAVSPPVINTLITTEVLRQLIICEAQTRRHRSGDSWLVI